MADPHSSGHYQGTAAVSQKRTVVDAAAGGGAGRPATAAKRPCFTCACSAQPCYCGAASAAAAVAAAAAVSSYQHNAGQSGRSDSRWGSIAPPAAASPSAQRPLVTAAPVVTISRATGTSGQFTVSSASAMITSPRHAGNLLLHHHQLHSHSAQHQHRHQSGGSSSSSSSGTATYLRASPRAATAAPLASMSASASDIMNDLMRSVVVTSAVTMSARPSPSTPASSAVSLSARPRAAGSTGAEVQATSLPVSVVWPPVANGSTPSTPGSVVHYVPGSLGDIRQQAAASAANRLIAERRLFRCTGCDFFTTQQHKLAAHADYYHSSKPRAGPMTVRMVPSVSQSSAAAAAVPAVNSGMGSRAVLSSPPAAVSATDAAVRSLSATSRVSHTPERMGDTSFRGGLAVHGSGDTTPMRATMMTSTSGSPGAGHPSGGIQIWWPPAPGSKPSSVPAGHAQVQATRPTAGTISCPYCTFKATLPNLLQLHVANRHGDQLQSNYQRSSSHPASHTTRIADVLPAAAPVPPQTAAAPGRTADNERAKTNSADHDDPDVIITSWTMGPAVSAVQSPRLTPAPSCTTAVPVLATAAASTAASPAAQSAAASPAAVLACAQPAAPGVQQFASASSETLPSHSNELARVVIDPLPLGCRQKPLSPLPLQQSVAGVTSAGSELVVQQMTSGDRRPLSELLAGSPPPPPPLLLLQPPRPLLLLQPPLPLLQSPASITSAGVELAQQQQLSSGDRRPPPELPPSPGIPISSPAPCVAIDLQSPSSPAVTHTRTTSADEAAEQLPAAGLAEASSSWADDSPAAALLPIRSAVEEPSSPPSADAGLGAQPCAAPDAADASLHALAEPAATVDESHTSVAASRPDAFTWEDLVSIGMDCAPLDAQSGSSAAAATASADAASATEKVLKAERQPSPCESSSRPSYFWSEQVLLGGLLFENYYESAATGGRPSGEDKEPHERCDESVSPAGAVGACRSQSESVDRSQHGLDKKLQVIGIVGGGDGGASSAQSAAERSSNAPWSEAGEGCVSREAPAAGDCPSAACGGAALVHARPREALPSSSSSADASVGGSGASSMPAPSAAAVEHPCSVLPALLQDKLPCVAELGEPIATGNVEYSTASAATSSPVDSPFISGATSEQPSEITSVEQQAACLSNGRSMNCVEETKSEISNVFTAKHDATDSGGNLRDPDDHGRALITVKAGMLPVVSADGMQSLLKQEHETEGVVSPAIFGQSHDMAPADDSSSRIRNGNTAKEMSPSNAANEFYRSGIAPLTHNHKSLPAEVVGDSCDGGKETTSFSSPGPAIATRQRRLHHHQQQLTTASSSSTSPALVGSRERPAKRRSCLLAMDRVRETSACHRHKHKVAKGTSRSAAAAAAEASSSPASKLRRLVKHKQPRCACCCVSPAAAVGRSSSRAAATSRLVSAKKRQCSKQHVSRAAAAAAARRRCGSRAAATSRLASAKKRQCSKQHANRAAAAARRRCSM